MRRDDQYQNEKESPKGKISSGLVLVVFGIVWTTMVSSVPRDPFFQTFLTVFTCVGVLIVIAGLANVFSGIKERNNEQEETVREIQADIERQKREEQTRAALARVEKPREKKFAYCPYCGTMQDEDYKICESCGAGRKR